MKILFLISVYGHGRGGHFHSLNHISKKIGENNDVKIVSFGPGKSNIIESNPYFAEHIPFNGFNFYNLKTEITKLTYKFNPDIYHCFDVGSYNTIRLLISSKTHKIILNKCGGPNPIQYPHIHNLILFSSENLMWFKNQKKYQYSNIHLIPNRVKSILMDMTFHPIAKEPGEFVFLRICRIGAAYNKSIIDSIMLIEKLILKDIINIKLYIVGIIEDYDIFNKLNEHHLVKNGRVIFLTDTAYTTEASKMIYISDAVIGTGRGLMEAASLSIPLLTIDRDGNIPVLLNSDNFFEAFETNFSERNVFNNNSYDSNINNIVLLIKNKIYYSEISKFSKQAFDEYFNIDKVTKAYHEAYASSIHGKKKIMEDIFIIMRSFIKFFKNNLSNEKEIL